MIKKSLIQGLFITMIFYTAIVAVNAFFEIPLFEEQVFGIQTVIAFYLMISVGSLMFMRI